MSNANVYKLYRVSYYYYYYYYYYYRGNQKKFPALKTAR